MIMDTASFLKELFSKRASQNPRYSMRAFARTLGVSPSGLSQILNRKKRLSIDRAHEFVSRLNLENGESERLITLVEIESTSNSARRLELIRKMELQNGATNLTLDNFNLIASWYGFAVLVMVTECRGFFTTADIAMRLGITKAEVEVTLDRLQRLELIEIIPSKTQAIKIRRLHDTVLVQSDFVNDALKKYYRELQLKTDESLNEQTPETRVSGAQAFAFDPAQISEVKRLTDKYLNELEHLSALGKKRTEVYQAVAHVYQLTKLKGHKK